MATVTALIFHQPTAPGEGELCAMLARARAVLAEHHRGRFERAGARARIVPLDSDRPGGGGGTFGEHLSELARGPLGRGGLVVLGSGAVPLLRRADAVELVRVAARPDRQALTNNRFSSDVCAIARADGLRALPSLPGDNALPRWLAEEAGYLVLELPGRARLAMDLDSPLDLALLALGADAPAALRRLASREGLAVPRADDLRRVAADPHGELLVAGRAGSETLRWLERSTRCRVRFLAEERGLRSGAMTPRVPGNGRPGRAPRSVLGRLLDLRGPDALGATVAELADGALIDARVLLADRLGPDERGWPRREDRFAADLALPAAVRDPWLARLAASAASAPVPVLLGGHTLVGPGARRLLAATGPREASGEPGSGRSLR
jgi:hypothetical protein